MEVFSWYIERYKELSSTWKLIHNTALSIALIVGMWTFTDRYILNPHKYNIYSWWSTNISIPDLDSGDTARLFSIILMQTLREIGS